MAEISFVCTENLYARLRVYIIWYSSHKRITLLSSYASLAHKMSIIFIHPIAICINQLPRFWLLFFFSIIDSRYKMSPLPVLVVIIIIIVIPIHKQHTSPVWCETKFREEKSIVVAFFFWEDEKYPIVYSLFHLFCCCLCNIVVCILSSDLYRKCIGEYIAFRKTHTQYIRIECVYVQPWGLWQHTAREKGRRKKKSNKTHNRQPPDSLNFRTKSFFWTLY